MMVGHISDTHLGAFIGRDEELREVAEDVNEAFIEAIDLFVREHVDVVIHSGDILDVPRPYGDALKTLLNGVKKLNGKGIPFLYTFGEHDVSPIPSMPYPYLASLLELAEYVGDGRPHEVKGLTVVGFHKYKKIDREHLVKKLEAAGEQARSFSGKKVLVLHQGIKEVFGPGSELSISEIPKGFDYYAMGHIHNRFVTKLGKGLLAYPGTSHWTEADDPDECGVLIVDLSGDEPQAQWVKLESVRPKARVRVDAKDLEKALKELMERESAKKPVLWMEVEGEEVNLKTVESRLAQKYVIRRLVLRRRPKEGFELGHVEELDIDAELRKSALKVIGDEEVVEYALGELLKLLSEGEVKEAEQSLWEFWRKRYGMESGEGT
jgi:DNA repair exonuclease SbcCD nuclease subunit